MSDNLTRLPYIVTLCRQTKEIILQNCAVSIFVKICAVVVAVLGAYYRFNYVMYACGDDLCMYDYLIPQVTYPCGVRYWWILDAC